MWRFQLWFGIMVIAQLPCCAMLHCTYKWMPCDSDVILECKLQVHLLCSQTIDACAPWDSKCHSMISLYIWPGSLLTPSPYCCVCVGIWLDYWYTAGILQALVPHIGFMGSCVYVWMCVRTLVCLCLHNMICVSACLCVCAAEIVAQMSMCLTPYEMHALW